MSAATEETAATAARYAQKFPNWRHVVGRPICPRVVVGKRCLEGHPDWAFCGWCSPGLYPSITDHPRRWRTPDGQTVITYEPYSAAIQSQHLDMLETICELLGVTIIADDDSPYFPGSTRLFMLRRFERVILNYP